MTGRTRVLFVNSGILGQGTFSKFVREAMTVEPGIDAWHIVRVADRTLDIPADHPGRIANLCGSGRRHLHLAPGGRLSLGRAAREQVLRDTHPDDYRRRLVHIIDEATHRPSVSRVA